MTDRRQESADSDLLQQRKDNTDQKWIKNPKKSYKRARSDCSAIDTELYRIEQFQSFINQHDKIPDEVGLRDVVKEDIYKYLHEDLDCDPELNDKTIEEYLFDLSYFYKVLVAHNVRDDNPVYQPDREEGDTGALDHVRKSEDYNLDPPNRPHIPFHRMKAYLEWLTTHRCRAIHMTALKSAARTSAIINLDLRCLNISHPAFETIIDEHDVILDPRIENKPDSLLIYEEFGNGTKIPNKSRPGPDNGEIRDRANKRKEDSGSVIPIDSELKTALMEWLLTRPPSIGREIHPCFVPGSGEPRRINPASFSSLWNSDIQDSARRFGKEESLESCPNCGGEVKKKNPEYVNPGRHYDCQDCGERHWRSIMWSPGLNTPQKFVFHCNRHFFSDGVRKNKSEITDNEMKEVVRKYKIRGDSAENIDADALHYSHPHNLDWEKDVRRPYLDAIYKFGIYDSNQLIPAVGEGWQR